MIDGGNGNDRITAGRNTARNPETIHGGAGNDVIIWNNGDGDDINEGDAGVDETLIVEGTADDGNIVTPEGHDHALRAHLRRRRLQGLLETRWRSSPCSPSPATTRSRRAPASRWA